MKRLALGLLVALMVGCTVAPPPAGAPGVSSPQLAVYDDGNTLFTAVASADGSSRVLATNHLTGEATAWQLDGLVRQLALTAGALFVVQEDRVHLIRIQESG